MKKFAVEFVKRGTMFSVLGPVIMAIVYAVLGAKGVVDSVTVAELVKGIVSSSLLAFIAAGISAVYTVDKLQMAPAALIQASVLYLDYVLIYLFNGWIPMNGKVIGIFSVIFAAGYALIWCIIYLTIRASTKKLNENLTF